MFDIVLEAELISNNPLGGIVAMKLHFRGADYEASAGQVPYVEGPVQGTYRGAPWRQHRTKSVAYDHQAQELTYRGVHYKH